MNFLSRIKIFHPDEREKYVYTGAPWVLVFSIGKLQGLTSSCSKAFKKFLFLKCYTTLSVPKTTILEILGRK